MDEQQTMAADANEPLRAVDLPASDDLLRDDVRRLGALVGEILAEQVSPEFLTEVEALRVAAIRRREDGAPMTVLSAHLTGLPLAQAESLVRAFSTWFQAINLAERVHRIRRRRDYQRLGGQAQPGSLVAVLTQLRTAGVTLSAVQAVLARLRIEPVFTAHPTEAVRRALLEKERDLVRCLIEDIDRTLTPQERRADIERMRLALTAGWQTAESRPEKPTVADELEHVGYYLGDVLYRVLPVFHEVFTDALAQVYGEPACEVLHNRTQPAPLLGFASWVGGDMDGNPNVGADTIRATLASQRAQVLSAYRRDVGRLATVLTQSAGRVAVSEAVQEQIDSYARLFPDTAGKLPAEMPYRSLLRLMQARLQATSRDAPEGYPDSTAFIADLRRIEASLLAYRGEHAGAFAVRRVLRRAEAFGFHLATLDIRQDSAQHDQALSALLADDAWSARPWPERVVCLRAVLDGRHTVLQTDAPAATRALAVFAALAECLARYGRRAIGPYIVSMSRSAADALAVLALARVAGLVDAQGAVPLDVAPLFETVNDLDAAADTLRSLFADPAYRAHLATRQDRQQVMLGYSDSAKDGGLLASRWALQQTQVRLTQLARESGIDIVFFHGRGGSVSRGGGKTEKAVMAAPRGTVNAHLRFTEQGEVIHRKYGIRALALRNLEQVTGAVLRATLTPRPAEPREAHWREQLIELAAVARQHYRALVYQSADFPDYFRAATPIDVIERLRIGSRPSKRKQGRSGLLPSRGTGPSMDGVDALRAIPWVFAWSQNRCGLTAWYGVGTALTTGIARYGIDAMREMARDWPFFATVIDDVEMVLAKSELAIFERYSQLAGPLHARFYPAIADEFQRCREAVLAIKASDELLAHDFRLRQSIRLRNPYVDPISVLQVDLLARWRQADRPDDALFHALVATVNGIAAGVQNTG